MYLPRETCIYIETASTHTGTNVEYSRTSLKLLLGEEALATPSVVVVQQPQLHLRTTLTWEKQTGVAPLAWTLQPTEAAVGRPLSEMRKYALGSTDGYLHMPRPTRTFASCPRTGRPRGRSTPASSRRRRSGASMGRRQGDV